MLVVFYVILISSFHRFRPPGMDGVILGSRLYISG